MPWTTPTRSNSWSATILSAQCTDERVNLTTPALFARFPDAYALAAADPEEVEDIIHSTGFFRAKARNLIGMATAVVDRFGGEVPSSMSDLVVFLESGGRRPTWCVVWPSTFLASRSTPTCNDCRPGSG